MVRFSGVELYTRPWRPLISKSKGIPLYTYKKWKSRVSRTFWFGARGIIYVIVSDGATEWKVRIYEGKHGENCRGKSEREKWFLYRVYTYKKKEKRKKKHDLYGFIFVCLSISIQRTSEKNIYTYYYLHSLIIPLHRKFIVESFNHFCGYCSVSIDFIFVFLPFLSFNIVHNIQGDVLSIFCWI